MDTLPHKMVVKRKLESLRINNTFFAPFLGEASASISSRSLVRLKKAKFNPENIADCDKQKAIPIQIIKSFMI
jgi:hypothetical protein